MLVGDSIVYRGRRYVVNGVTPMSVTPFRVELRDPATGETAWVAWPPLAEVERVASRRVENDESHADAGESPEAS
jgi:hypothetical protein